MGEVRRETSKRELIYYTGTNFAEIKTAWDEYYEWTSYPPTLTDHGTYLVIDGVGGMPATRVDPGWALAKKPLEWHRDPMWSPAAIEAHFASVSSGFAVQVKNAPLPALQMQDPNGTVTVTWEKPFVDANYSVQLTPIGQPGLYNCALQSQTAGDCVVAVEALVDMSAGYLQVTGIHP